MSAILNSLNAHNFLISQPILMTLVSKFMVCRALSDKAYLSLGLLSPLNVQFQASPDFLWLYNPVCVGPGRKPRKLFYLMMRHNYLFNNFANIDLSNFRPCLQRKKIRKAALPHRRSQQKR